MSDLDLSQGLFLVGGTGAGAAEPDAVYKARRKQLVRPVAKGVFVTASLRPDEVRDLLRRCAVRIAMHIYPERVYLAGTSAVHLGLVDNVLLVSAPWTRAPLDVDGAFQIHFSMSNIEPGLNDEVVQSVTRDDFGQLLAPRLGDVMLLLKDVQKNSARPRSTYLTLRDRAMLVERFTRMVGPREMLMSRIEAMGHAHGLAVYVKSAKLAVGEFGEYEVAARPTQAFDVFWHEQRLASLSNDGTMWSFEYAPGVTSPLADTKSRRGQVPSFIGSIMPEQGARIENCMDDNLGLLSRWSRYLSNIAILPQQLGSARAPMLDHLQGRLAKHRDHFFQFNGVLEGDLGAAASDDRLIQSLSSRNELPRISGQQVKLAVNLASNGALRPAVDCPFTHILKVAPSVGQDSSLGVMEWFSLVVAKASGLVTEEFALVDTGTGAPALLAERFDARENAHDKRMLLSEDFWSIKGLRRNEDKYEGELLEVADILMEHSTDREADGRDLFMQALYSWLTMNHDMHLKNISILRIADSASSGITSVRLTPMYDVLCTKVYDQTAATAAIKLAGSSVYTLEGFRLLGKRLDIPQEEVDARISYLATAVRSYSQMIASDLPAAVKRHAQSMRHIQDALVMFEVRCQNLQRELDGLAQLHELNPDEVDRDVSFGIDLVAPEQDQRAAEPQLAALVGSGVAPSQRADQSMRPRR